MQRMFIKKCFLFTLGNVCRVKRFTNGSRNYFKDEEAETEGWKWLRQQSNAAGFDTLVKRWDKCVDIGG
jgi:hypothetical protein